MSGHLHAPATLAPGKSPQYPLDRRWVDPRVGLDDVEKRKFLTQPRLEFGPLNRPANSQFIYLIRYPVSCDVSVCFIIPDAVTNIN
jgi:hypothetical protein